jgi:hypothetical protein
MNLEVGSTIGDYQVLEILGAGGMGKVYKVRNVISDRIEAMKVLLPDLAQEPELADRFLREIKVQASLEHPNIAALHTAVRAGNQLLMLIEYVEGMTLEQKLARGPLPAAEAADYIRQVLAALEYAHGRGVVHRDIKPANMMLTPGGVVKLMDFGIAKSAVDRRLTMTGTTMGSLYYMSPEQIQGATTLDARSDLYSVGVSLYELVTGKRPFDGDSQFAIMSAHLEKTPVPPVEIDSRLPSMLNDVIMMSVLKDPNARFQTAAAFRNALGSVAVAEPPPTMTMPANQAAAAPAVAAAQPAAAALQAGPPRSKRGLWMAVGAIAAVLAVVAFVQFGPLKHGKAAQDTAAPQNIPTREIPVVQPPSPAPAAVEQPPSQPAEQPAVAKPAPQVQQQRQPVVRQPEVRSAAPQPQTSATPAVQTPTQAPAQTPPQPPVQAQPKPQAAPAVDPAQVEKAREALMMLNVRANGIRGTLQNLQAQQAARGLNMNAKFQEPLHLMDNYLQAAESAIAEGNLAQAKSYSDKAERQIERLEKDLNR